MIRFRSTLVLFFAMIAAASAAPRFGLVRVTDIYRDLPATKALQEEIQKKRDAILRDERAEELRKIVAELQAMQKRLQDKDNPPDEETMQRMAQAYEVRRQEAQTLQQEFENHRAEKTREINQEMVGAMRETLNRIVAVSNKLAKERGYDGILDSSGNTNTGLPFLLYSKSAPDLTEDVIAALKDEEAAAPAGGSATE